MTTKHRVFSMTFAKVYPLYVDKAEKKGRSQAEVDQIIKWLLGYTPRRLATILEKEVDIETFIKKAPKLKKKVLARVIATKTDALPEKAKKGLQGYAAAQVVILSKRLRGAYALLAQR